VLVTGFDIIYFWVARMIFMGLEFMNEKPFTDVLIHGLVRDALGRKMSKSLDNGVDPLEVIEEFGADALRFTLVSGVAPGNDMRYHPEKVEASRNFANKIWNAARFALMHLEGFTPRLGVDRADEDGEASGAWQRFLAEEGVELADRWILSRYHRTVAEVTRHLGRYDLGEGARTLYDFIWSEFCDWYIELVKERLNGRRGEAARRAAQQVLWYVLKGTLELLHPYMPFITEELWQHLPGTGESIVVTPWPTSDPQLIDPRVEEAMDVVMDVIKAIRNIRAEKGVPPGRQITAVLHCRGEAHAILTEYEAYVRALARVGTYRVEPTGSPKPERAATAVAAGVEVFLPLADLVDVQEEIARLKKELNSVLADLERSSARLNNPGFIEKAPAHVVEGARKRHAELEETAAKIRARLEELE